VLGLPRRGVDPQGPGRREAVLGQRHRAELAGHPRPGPGPQADRRRGRARPRAPREPRHRDRERRRQPRTGAGRLQGPRPPPRAMRRRGSAAVTATPVLIGAVTVLVIAVAVFLAYNANNGLPFVPTHTLYVDLPDGSNLIKGDEVRQGGFLIGNMVKLE